MHYGGKIAIQGVKNKAKVDKSFANVPNFCTLKLI